MHAISVVVDEAQFPEAIEEKAHSGTCRADHLRPLLRQAINNGYHEGFRAGRADSEDRWRSNYQDSYAYQDANYGYNGYYIGRDDYNYYFREGFRRGYEDGYYNRYQYGSYSNGNYSVLGPILGQILGFQSIR